MRVGRFRPRFWLTLFTIPVLLCLVGLGTWQLQRLEWKEALIAERESRAAKPARELPARFEDPDAWSYMRVVATGRFLPEHEAALVARTRDGQVGFHILTPLRLEDGRLLVVDRGWMPQEKAEAVRPDPPEGSVTVEGLLVRTGWKGASFVRPENQPGKGLYHWVDATALAEAEALEGTIESVYLQALPSGKEGYPLGTSPEVELRNPHLGYAFTWYGLALVLIVIYVSFHLHRSRRELE